MPRPHRRMQPTGRGATEVSLDDSRLPLARAPGRGTRGNALGERRK